MNKNIFFEKKNIKIKKIFPNHKFKENFIVNSVKPLISAEIKDAFNYAERSPYPDISSATEHIFATS